MFSPSLAFPTDAGTSTLVGNDNVSFIDLKAAASLTGGSKQALRSKLQSMPLRVMLSGETYTYGK